MRRTEEEVAQNIDPDMNRSIEASEIRFIFISKEITQPDNLFVNSPFDSYFGYKYTFEVEADGEATGEKIEHTITKDELKRFRKVEDFHNYLRKYLLYKYNIGVERRKKQKLVEELELIPGEKI